MKKNYILCTVVFMLIAISSYAQLTTLLNFAGTTNGSNPQGSLVSDGTFLYGMTREGGTNGLGTIFKIMPNGTGYVKLMDFAGATNGSDPRGSLIYDGTYLYGMTWEGGINDIGTIFKILPNGSGYVKLFDFSSTTGGRPLGSLTTDGTFLYGMTSAGSLNSLGSIFKIMPNGTGFVKLMDFAGATNGGNPYGSLYYDGTYLYGMTVYGGNNNLGTIFKIMPNGTGFVKLLDFAGASNGSNPWGALISDGTFLYGMTSLGGSNNLGTIFKILPNGTGYLKLLDLGGSASGMATFGSLISDGTFLYGMTIYGGANGVGTIFKIMPDGSDYMKLSDFSSSTNGSNPYGSLIFNGALLYGMTSAGGTNGSGVVFKYCPATATATNSGDYCAGSTIQLNSTGGNSYLWSGPLSYTSTAQNPSIASSTTNMSGIYSVTVTNAAGCSASATTNVIVNDCASIEENNPNAIVIFPNPTTGIVNVSASFNGSHPLSITNILGEVVLKKEINLTTGITIPVDLSDKPSGIYLLTLGNSVQRIIKQ